MTVSARRRAAWPVRALTSRVSAILDSVRVPQVIRRLRALVPEGEPRRKIVILAHSGRLSAVRPWLRAFHADTIHILLDQPLARGGRSPAGNVTLGVARHPRAIERTLRDEIGSVDLIIDLRPPNVARYTRTWGRAAYHVRRHGMYIARPSAIRWSRVRGRMLAWAALNSEYGPVRVGHKDLRANELLDPDVSQLTLVLGEAIAVVKRQDHLLFVTDKKVATIAKRETGLAMDVLDELPAGIFQGRAEVTSHPSARPVQGLSSKLRYPRLQLRHYTGQISFYGQTLLISGHSVLPDSHRFYRWPQLKHPLIPSWPKQADFATLPDALRPQERLKGTYYLLDPQFTGHYGHLMTEAIPRLWGWDRAKAQIPELKVLTKVKPGRMSEPVLDRLLAAYGNISADDVVYVDHPVELESVVTASAMWHNQIPHFVHPDIVAVWNRLGRALADPSAPGWDRIFITRRPGSLRTCHNAVDVEAVFAAHGFEIVRPEHYDLGIQAGFFRTAKVVAGFGGSGMFNLMYTANLEQVIVLAHESYSARNEHLYSSVLGGRADWFWSSPERRRFHSDWNFDFDRNGRQLEKLLVGL